MSDVISAERESADLGAVAADGGLYVMAFWDQASVIASAQTELEALNTVQDVINLYTNTIITPTSPAVVDVFQAVQNAITADELPYEDTANFFNWLRYTKNEQTITLEDAQGGQINQWLVQYGTQVLGLNIPGAPVPGPIELPSPSVGQTTVAKGAREVKPQTITAPAFSADQAAAIQAAIGIASADILKVQAAVIDAMLPDLAPGQVPQALNQLNTAASALENQMGQVMKTLDASQQGTLAAQLNGALEALHGLSQEVNTLADQVAEKASSALEDSINTNTAEIALVSGELGAVVNTVLPTLSGQIDTVASQTEATATTVANEIKPELAQVSQTTDNLTNELSGTDKECLDQLCDAINNVSNPIKEGGATPGLLKGLGNLLTKAIELGILATIVDALVTVADAPIALSAVVQDTELMSKWATSAANVITTDYSWLGPLPHG